MLQLQAIREQKDEMIAAFKKRNIDGSALLAEVLQLDEKRRATQTRLDSVLAESNSLSKEIGILYKSGKAKEASGLKEKTAALKEESKQLNDALTTTANALQTLLYQIPNVPHNSVPSGSSEADNEEIFSEGEIPELITHALPHWELAKKYDIIDFELGVKIAGAGFPVYKGRVLVCNGR
jgi:seryl-tRNA synthetase